ncbi:MAG: cupredoxin domain-containing protein [Syntrophales bacterium]|nr:cupredoxin domain-containing protein [Syntrophales bacterium]
MKKYFMAVALTVLFGTYAFANEPHDSMQHSREHMGDPHHEMNADVPLSGRVENGIRIVEVRASQYKFEPDPIVVRLGEKVRLSVTSADTAHGIAIVDFNVNLFVPAKQTKEVEFTADKKGTFHAHCSVYCGPGHAKMHGSLIVKE